MENIRERFRPTDELGVAVLHETVAHDQAQRAWPPLRPTIEGQVLVVTTWCFQWAGSFLEESPRSVTASLTGFVFGSTPELDQLGGHAGQIWRNRLRLRQPVHGQGSIAGSGDEGTGAAHALRPGRLPYLRRHQANRGGRHIELLGDHVVNLRRWLESPHTIDAERSLEPGIDAGVLQRTALWIGRRIR